MIVSRTEIRVRYADTDQMKMVYYGKFFEYFEQGRSDLLRQIGLPYSRIESMGFLLPVAEARAKYLRPARYDDLLAVSTILKEVPAARVTIHYELHETHRGDMLATGTTVHSFIDAKTGRVTRAPSFFTEAVTRNFSIT